MRGVYAIFAALVLVGCRTVGAGPTPAERCDAKPSAGWRRLAGVPANAKDLMQLPAHQGRTVASWWGVAAPAVEVWFERDATHLKACHFQDIPKECGSQITFVEFTRVADHWEAGTVLTEVCIADRRAR